MKITKVEDFIAFQKATEYWRSVNALLEKPGFRKDRKLLEQIRGAIDSITSNFTEGFEQPTDRAFARYVFTAKGSTAESRNRLKLAQSRGYITAGEFQDCDVQADEVARLLTGVAKYLRNSDRLDRGLGRKPRHQSGSRPAIPPPTTND